ncbi:hypothetical protein ACIP9H_18545 [Streptomyces sp. NPDC088732]|uniref:hypothetical protein n=1 Tax=Streptomyces sp. NPDC088732 TaxID=3365879 RepID=UPI00382CB0DC
MDPMDRSDAGDRTDPVPPMDSTGSMDDFERRLARMMHASERHTPFEPRHRERLRGGVASRRRVRTVWQAGSSAVAVTAIACALVLLPGSSSGQVVPAGPGGAPTSGTSYPSSTSSDAPSPSGSATSSPTFSPPSGTATGGTSTAAGSDLPVSPSTATASVGGGATGSATSSATNSATAGGTASGGATSTTSPPVSPYGNATGTG